MKLVVVVLLSSLTLATATSRTLHRSFTKSVKSLKSNPDYVDDMDETMKSETIHGEKERKVDVYSNEVELLVREDKELKEDPDKDDTEDEEEPDWRDNFPEELDLRELGIMHKAINQGGKCNSCGWVSGTQTLEARIALVSENYIPYSIQGFMNCGKGNTPCSGAVPYTVTSIARQSNVIAPERDLPYTRDWCLNEGKGNSACRAKCPVEHPDKFNNTLHDQFVVITGSGKASTEEQLVQALQSGPVTTCFSRKGKGKGELCRNGCLHANSIVGYTKDKWILQESYGLKFGNDGSWKIPRGSICSKAIIQKAYFPKIIYDYDRANAYYKAVEGGVSEKGLQFVDKGTYGIAEADVVNMGTAKNKCAFLGAACKGVVALSSGTYELVSDFGVPLSGDQIAFKKVQMIVYLKHEESGMYLGITKKNNQLQLVAVSKQKAAPFFTSYSRFISHENPRYHIVDNQMKLITGSVRDIDVDQAWTLKNCNIYSEASGKSFDIVSGKRGSKLGGSKYDPAQASQRFDIGLSDKWTIVSSKLQLPLAKLKKENEIKFTGNSKARILRYRWNARQIINVRGHPFNPEMELTNEHFKFENTKYIMRPRNCGISKLNPMGWEDHLALQNNKVVMSSNIDSNWTFEYGDL